MSDGSLDTPWDDEAPAQVKPKRRFKLVAFDQIKVNGAGLYLVKRLIPREGLVIVWGPPKCGKSFWTFDLAMHIVLGWEYRGRRVTQGTVVYVACEGEMGLGARAEAYRRERLDHSDQAAPLYLIATRLDLARERERLIADIRAQLGDEPVSAIVIDTLNRSLAGSESSDEDMAAYIRGADALREAFRCAVVVIHHCGVNDQRPRGHTSLTGAADAQIAVKRDEGGTIIATVEFMKDGEAGATIASALRVVELDRDEDGDPITSCIIDPTDAEQVSPKRGPAKLPGASKIALDLLRGLIDAAGEIPPASNHIPPGAQAVKAEGWRKCCYQGSITAGETQQAQQKAFTRSAKKLQELGFIGAWDGWVWLPHR